MRKTQSGKLKNEKGEYLDPYDETDSLHMLREAYNSKPRQKYTPDEEKAAFEAYAAATGKHKQKLEEELVLQYLPLVFKHALNRNFGKEQYADCIMLMLCELLKLIRKYTTDSGVSFCGFAKKRLYFSAQDYFQKKFEREKKECLHEFSEEQTLEGLEAEKFGIVKRKEVEI